MEKCNVCGSSNVLPVFDSDPICLNCDKVEYKNEKLSNLRKEFFTRLSLWWTDGETSNVFTHKM